MFVIMYTKPNFYEKTSLDLIKKDDLGKILPVIELNSLLTFVETEREFLEFANGYLFNIYILLMEQKTS
jgi:hypothetical protein